jgi:superfamily II DNA or RNA helicase
MKLRAYQEEAINKITNSLKSNRSCLVVMPTGTGKTIVFAELLKMMDKGRGMVVAHREELINQAVDKIKIVTGIEPDVEMADRHADLDYHNKSKVVVSSVQTQIAGKPPRMEKFSPESFSLLILDEAHHASAKSWRKVVEYYQRNPTLKIIGFTATPDRLDRKALGDMFETVAFEYGISDAIKDGWLVPIKQQMVEVTALDYSSIRTTAGDLNGRDLAQVMEDEVALHEVATPAVELMRGRKALVFASSVYHAQRLAEIFNRHDLTAECVSGKTPKIERAEIVKKFSTGEIKVLCNVGCFTEGFDDPGVEVVIMARPTKSRALYSQMVGRGTRPLSGLVDQFGSPLTRRSAINTSSKPYVEIIDFSGNCGRHKLVTCMSVLGGNSVPQEVLDRAHLIATESDEPVDPRKTIEIAEEQIAKEEDEKRRLMLAKRAKLRAKVKYGTTPVDPFNTLDIHVPVENDQYERGATDKQIDFLAKHGINAEPFTFRQASKVTTTIIMRLKSGLSTPKQIQTLKRFNVEAKNMSKKDASKEIDRIASNGWRN